MNKYTFVKILFSFFFISSSQWLGAQENPLQVLVIGAHPDDADLCAGGTAALWAGMGHQVKFLSLTNGDAGHQNMGGGALAKRRRAEAQASARRLGIAEYEVLDNHDGELIPSLDVRLQVIRRIRQWKADVVIVSRPNDYHPDHRNTGLVVQDAAYMVIVPNVASDTPPLEKNPVFLYCEDRFQKPNPFEPDIAVNIDPVVEKKVDALDAHVSQFYEWLPWTIGRLDEVPGGAGQRKQWLAQWRGQRPLKEATRASLVKWYGPEKGKDIQQAEAFEICEYGAQPNEERIQQLFPMLGKNTPHLVSKMTNDPVSIDGRLDEPVYQHAAKIFLKNSLTKEVISDPAYTTYAQVFHDAENLYIAFSANDLDIHSSYSQRDEPLYKEEAIEVFIDTDQQPNDYVEIEVSPKNILYDSWIVDPKNIQPATKTYDLKGIKTAVQLRGTTQNRQDADQNWTVEMAIPFKELIEDYHPDQLDTYSWKINFYRLNVDASPLKHMAWSPTQGSFHQPEKFGTIIFRKEK